MTNYFLERYKNELLTLLASLLWGSSFVAVKMGLKHLDPLWFVQLRLFWAALILIFVTLSYRKIRSYFFNKTVWVLGITNGLAYLFQFIGMQSVTASAAAFYVNFGIVFAAILSYLILKERFTKLKIAGIGMALTGVFLLSTNGNAAALVNGNIFGELIVLISGFFWATYLVLTKRFLTRTPIAIVPLTSSVLLVSSLILLLPALIWGNWPQQLDLSGGTILAYTTIFCTVVPFLLWTRGLTGISATVSAGVLLAEPIFAVVLAYPILGELFQLFEMLGAFLILTAIALLSFAEEENK